MRSQPLRQPDKGELETLYRFIDVADHSGPARAELLLRLGFLRRSVWISQASALLFRRLEIVADPVVVVAITLVAAVFISMDWARTLFFLAAFLMAYVRWTRAQRNGNVKDAMVRKDGANKMILEHADLLAPYVGNVFGLEARYVDRQLSDVQRTTVDMYVFTEIDNLEFVFDKARAGLIEDDFAIRAIKIFVARAENRGFFNVAFRLIVDGRYNGDFGRAAKLLLHVAQLDGSALAP